MKKNILAIFLILIIFIAGCKTGGTSKSITDADVRKGTEGLSIEFIKNAPPEKVFEGSIFPVALRMKNKGASDIPDKETSNKGFLVFGLEEAYVTLQDSSDQKKELNIRGKSIFNLNGNEEFINVNMGASKVVGQSETHPSSILATACYPYKTVLGTSVCVDTDVFGTRLRNKACEVKDVQFNDGQGAPVAITKIEPRMLPDADENAVKPHFIISIENKGAGQVISQEKLDQACSSKPLSSKDFNIIKIKASLSNEELNCNIADSEPAESKLRQKKSIARCTLERGIERSQDAYSAPLRIELEYGYTLTISKDIIIERILKY